MLTEDGEDNTDVEELDELINRLEQATDFRDQLEELVSVYPFNEYEYVISHLLAAQKLSIEEYRELRDSYIERNLSSDTTRHKQNRMTP